MECAWVVVLLADLWALSWPLVAVRSQDEIYKPSACVAYLAERRGEHGRVLDRGLGEPSVSPLDPALPLLLEIESLRGYNSLDVRRYKQYLAFISDDDRPQRPRTPPFGFPIKGNISIVNKPLLDQLGPRYLLQPSAQKAEPGWLEVEKDEHPRSYQIIVGGMQDLPPFSVYENPAAFPRAFVVPDAAPLPAAILATLKTTDFRRCVLLEGAEAKSSAGNFRAATIPKDGYTPNRVVVKLDEASSGYLVLTDVWFPGWTCTVDGRETKVYRANYLFRAVELPPGAREVVFTFAPLSYRWGKGVSIGALAVVSVVFAAGFWWRRSSSVGAGSTRFRPPGEENAAAASTGSSGT